MWDSQPLNHAIIEVLSRKKDFGTPRALAYDDLLSKLRIHCKREIGTFELNRELMKLELYGIVFVSTLHKKKKLVELL